MNEAPEVGKRAGRWPVTVVATVAVVLWALVVCVIAGARYGGDIRTFLFLGEQFHHPPAIRDVPRLGPSGYDGQFYGALATDPLLRSDETIRSLDNPAYRATRIFVPLVAWLLGLGDPRAAVVLYQLISWGLGILGVVAAARWMQDRGSSAWWALLLVPAAGLATSVIRSTLNAASAGLVVCSLWAHSRRRLGIAVALLTAGTLTREIAFLGALAIAGFELLERRFKRVVVVLAVPVLPLLAVQAWLRVRMGTAFAYPPSAFGTPFTWVRDKFAAVFPVDGPDWFELWAVAGLLVLFGAAVAVAVDRRAWSAAGICFVGFVALAVALSWENYVEAFAFTRQLVILPILAVVLAAGDPRPVRRWSLRVGALLFGLSGVVMLDRNVSDLAHRSIIRRSLHQTAAWALDTRGGTIEARQNVPPGADADAVFVVPAANQPGRAGSLWQTALTIRNVSDTGARVRVDLVPGPSIPGPASATVNIGAGETATYHNALSELFDETGVGALRIASARDRLEVSAATYDAGLQETPSQLLPAYAYDFVTRGGETARLAGLKHAQLRDANVRTNLGLLNLTETTIPVRVRVLAGGREVGRFGGEVRPRSFAQLDDVFAVVKAGDVGDGVVLIDSPAPTAAFIAYASVVEGRGGKPRLVTAEAPAT